MYEIDWNEFADWTATKEGYFKPGDSTECAIAQYLKITFPEIEKLYISVWYEQYCIGRETHKIPENIEHLVIEFDQRPVDSENGESQICYWSEFTERLRSLGYGTNE